MTGQVRDATLIDTVLAYCAFTNTDPKDLEPLTFKEVVAKLASICITSPQWVAASQEIRKYYPVCHAECHIERIQAFMAGGCQWGPDAGPNEIKREGNVIPFPVNSTKH